MNKYLEILREIKSFGLDSSDRTGTGTRRISGAMFKHDLSEGFPLMTVKKIRPETVFAELEFFIKGVNDKRWLQERNCKIWDEWCSPAVVPYGTDADTLARMKAESYLGPIYGVNWRHWGADYRYDKVDGDWHQIFNVPKDAGQESAFKGTDQLKWVVETLKTNPLSRRMIVMSWDAGRIGEMALPPCHFAFQFLSDGTHLDIVFYMRSVDLFLGLPFNIASYAMLNHLVAKTVGMKPRMVVGMLSDAHIYHNHYEQVDLILSREPKPLPTLKLPEHVDLWNWTYTDFELVGYDPHPFVKAPVAV